MFCNYKDGSNLLLDTSFFEQETIKHDKVPISNFNDEINEQILRDTIQEMKTNDYLYHTISSLCEYIQANPIKVLKLFQVEDIISFFGSLIYVDSQESVLKCICIILQIISKYDILFDEDQKELYITVIEKIKFYSQIKKLIKDPSRPSIQKLAIWAAIYSLQIGQTTRFINTIIKAKGGDHLAEYLRFKFMKKASKFCGEMDDDIIRKISSFFIDSIKSINYDDQDDDHGYEYREQRETDKLILSQCLNGLNLLFSASFIPFGLIETNDLLPKISSFLVDPETSKLRYAAANILHSMTQTSQVSTEKLLEISLFPNLLCTAQFGDEKLLNLAVKIIEIPFSESDVYNVELLIDTICDFDLQKYASTQFKIKVEFLVLLGFIIPFCNDDQIKRLFTPDNVAFLCDMILIGDPSISSDISRLFYNALAIQRDLEFLEMVNSIIDESTALDTLKTIVTDPDTSKIDVDQIAIYLDEYWPKQE